MIAKTQTLEGYNSLVEYTKDKDQQGFFDPRKNIHFPMWDLEDCSIEQAVGTLTKVKHKYNLGKIHIVSDRDRSFRAWCFTRVTYHTLLKIILDTDFVDWNFFYYTVRRLKATLRISNKSNRQPQKIVYVIGKNDPELEIPKTLEHVTYDTGLEKRGLTLQKEIRPL